MRVLLDESLPRQLRRELSQHDVRTVPELGWAGTANGELLRLAEKDFDVFITMDRRLPDQQNMASFALCVMILLADSNNIDDLLPLVPALRTSLASCARGQVLWVRA